jgi:hypothetical protein
MKLPGATSHFSVRVRFGNYVARRVRRARLATLAADIEKATLTLTTLGRALEDADKPIQDAIADRDACDDDLDEGAQSFRANLAGRSADAARTTPYTSIFPEGISYYTAAPLDEEVARYEELKQRVEEHLPAADQARVKLVSVIDAGVHDFSAAVATLVKARTAESLASTRLSAATEAWAKQMEKAYGALVSEVGKAKAERFFPRARGKKAEEVEGAPGAGSPG